MVTLFGKETGPRFRNAVTEPVTVDDGSPVGQWPVGDDGGPVGFATASLTAGH